MYKSTDKITIAVVDVDEVTIPPNLRHRVDFVPTVTLFPARHKDEPSNFFDSNSDVNEYYKFVEANRTQG